MIERDWNRLKACREFFSLIEGGRKKNLERNNLYEIIVSRCDDTEEIIILFQLLDEISNINAFSIAQISEFRV